MSFTASFKINEKIVDQKTKLVLFKAMLKMFNTAKRLVPVDTGRLRNSIHLTPTLPGSSLFKLFTNVEYAAAVEFGTFKSRAQPYFRPALFQSKQKDVKVIFKDTFKK